MTMDELVVLVEEMRHAQKRYFQTKGNLSECKAKERKVDQALHEIRQKQKTLFS